jgi:hypothetical protein
MSWLRLDDQIPRHPKILSVGPVGAWFWVSGIAHCQSHLTDGFISDQAIQMIYLTMQLADAEPENIPRNRGRTHNERALEGNAKRTAKLPRSVQRRIHEVPELGVLLRRLLAAKLFDKAPGGYAIHDYLEHNLSRAQVNDKRQADLARKKQKTGLFTEITGGKRGRS